MNTILDIQKRLLQYNIKPSLQRIAVMQYLMENKTHPTADIIYAALSPAIPTLSRTTIYNTLKLLSEQGAIIALNIDEKNVRYDGDIVAHTHFRCKKCSRIYDLPKNFTLENKQQFLDFYITECQVYYKGYCKECKKTSINNEIINNF
ncbi:MAG: transcriptional repressor [Prevotellaceae bacterium]|jgi:Fur family ferric uptake transcriptional regulator/Fur family peroxide stress response transcriptional regulator|nr:transcriptional repressor [Prevotellaceae bacterium]